MPLRKRGKVAVSPSGRTRRSGAAQADARIGGRGQRRSQLPREFGQGDSARIRRLDHGALFMPVGETGSEVRPTCGTVQAGRSTRPDADDAVSGGGWSTCWYVRAKAPPLRKPLPPQRFRPAPSRFRPPRRGFSRPRRLGALVGPFRRQAELPSDQAGQAGIAPIAFAGGIFRRQPHRAELIFCAEGRSMPELPKGLLPFTSR